MIQKKKRFAQVGLGGRHKMFFDALLGDFSSMGEMVGLLDSNPGRLERAQRKAREEHSVDVPGYGAEDFDRMVREKRPDTVIVTSRDDTHDFYICRAMELGCDVISEKPMTMDAERCRKIIVTQRRTGRSVRVTFNYRYAPPRSQVKELLMSGVIGDVLSVEFQWMLDVHHGADYFRRWHRKLRHSGGLLVHKSTHHFDLVNWWLSSVPERVAATADLRFYTPATGDRYGLTRRGERCHGCEEAQRCPFHMDLAANASLKGFYLDHEKHDGYFRDRCVFSRDTDIYDTMNVMADYRSGARLSYSLVAYSPWEGYHVAFNGTRGRLEHKCEETVYVNADGSVPGALKKEGSWIRVYPHWKPAYEVALLSGEGGHGGGDPLLLRELFDPEHAPADPLMRAADQRSGAWSILTGIAANLSIAQDRFVALRELVPDLALPDYPAMPSTDAPLQRRNAQ